MATFYESDNSPIASELVRQGFTLDRGEALRIIGIDERASSTDTAIAIGTAAISLVAACGTLALSGFTLPILAPIAALAFAGLTAWNSRATKQEREFEAEFLHNHPEFVEAINQKLSAGEESDRVAAAYEHTLKAFINGDKSRMQSFLPTVISHQMAPYPVEELPIATSSPIGTATKFGAVEVPASPAGETSSQSAKPFDVTYDLGTHPQSALIAGVPGAGKGMIASNAIRHMKAQRPELTVMVIDPKADQKESGYWAGVANVVERLAFAENDPDDCATWLLLKVQQFQSLPTPKLLVMDEGAVIVQFLKLAHKDIKAMGRLKAFIAHISSMGDSAESWLWFITQMVNVDDLGISGGFRSIFRAIAVVAPKNINAVNAFLATTFVPMPSGRMEEIMSLMKQSPVNRAFYDGKSNQWYLMPELENHSGYDRDSRTYLKGKLPQVKTPDTNPRESLEKLFQDTPALPTAPAIELIESVPNGEKREALLIAYRWAVTRLEYGKDIDKGSFVERARKERNCAYLRDNRDEIWDELQGLVD